MINKSAGWLRRLVAFPGLVARGLRWGALRGGWLLEHLRRHRAFDRRLIPADQPIDIMVLCADHFEPARRHGDAAAVATVQSWCAAYEALADRHRDSDGRRPQHTWFYRYDYPNPGCVQRLSESVFHGYGEIEFHLHHGHDSAASFARTLEQGVAWFNRFGAMLTAEATPRPSFGYVAGNWALDNGAGKDSLSGCDTEITLLQQAGCYADFTFPALGSPAQPRMSNAIYYAHEDGKPKSYNTGAPVEVKRPPSGDLMIFQGPLVLDWQAGLIADGALEDFSPPHPRRLHPWLSAHVHVKGRPEWVFVKLHTHAMQSRATFLGPELDALFTAMDSEWNRPPFRLHYVTAREAYNIVKAAEQGCSGNPNAFRNHLLPVPANRLLNCDAPWRLKACTPERLHLTVLEPGPFRLQLPGATLWCRHGEAREIEIVLRKKLPIEVRVGGEGSFDLESTQLPQVITFTRSNEALLDTTRRSPYIAPSANADPALAEL